jgi:hypothetical protein
VKVKLFIDRRQKELGADCFISTRLGMKHTTINLPILSDISRALLVPRANERSARSNNPLSLTYGKVAPGNRYLEQDTKRMEGRRQRLR